MMKPVAAAISQEQSAVLSTTTATALASRNGEISTTSTVQALNPSTVVKNNPHLGSANVAFVGTSAGAVPPAAAAAAAAPSVTLINNVPPRSMMLPLREGKALNAVLPAASSNAIIQTSSLCTAVSSSSCTVISSSTGKARPIMVLLRPPIHTAGSAATPVAAATQSGSNIVINSAANLQRLPATAAASAATVGSGVSLQASLVNNQPDSSMPVTASIQVIESEPPKTIVQAASQQRTLTTSGQSTMVVNKIVEQTRQGGIPNPSRMPPPPPAPGTTTGMAKGTANTVAQSLLKTSIATTGHAPTTHLLPKPQNPTNIRKVQLPPGMVLIRCENGQLLMISQQTLAQMQAQTQSKHQNIMSSCPATTTSGPPVQKSTVQAPGTPIIAQQVTPITTIKQVSQAQKTVQPTTLQPAPLQHSPAGQPPIAVGGSAQTKQSGTPQVADQGAKTISAATTEAMANGKKCKNFLSTLIKLTSSGNQSTEKAAKIKELVQNLLDGKIEAEDFTSRLYGELNSSPQPYLLPFLKNSLPALRQLTPDSAAFIQQSQQQQPKTQATTALTAVVLSSSVQSAAGKASATVTGALRAPVGQQTQPAPVSVGSQGQPTLLVMQQHGQVGALIGPPRVTMKQPPKLALGQPHNRLILTTPQQIQVNQLKTISAIKPLLLPGTKVLSTVSAQLTAVQKNKPKEPGAGFFGNNDDINDVTFMAGVNLSEESARILATHSELVGTLARSCQEETFLLSAPLQRRILEIAKKHEITELQTDVVSYVSLATQQRLQNLIEKLSVIAQHKYISYKDDERYKQTSDVRAQFKFFEQLDQIAKRRKDEQEREMLMRAAMSRSRKVDPERLRLKQRAKELQEQELAQKRQRDADLTALEAIGPRRKKKMNSLESGSGTEGSGKSPAGPGSSRVGTTRQFIPQRKIRVNIRDLIFCLENEQETRHSLLLYKAFLK